MKQKIYVLCPKTRHPSGGVKQLFSLVDHLNALGYDAALIRKSPLKKVRWFDYSTKIVYFPYLYFLLENLLIKKKDKNSFFFKVMNFLFFNKSLPEKDSILVYPEIYGPNLAKLLPQHKFIVFNQNVFLTYNLFDYKQHQADPYVSENLLGVITVSEDSKRYLQYVYPNISVHRLRLGIKDSFAYSSEKRNQIAFMPRKLREDSNQVLNILQTRGKLKNWTVVSIDNASEEEVARILKESAIFLSFNYQEGLGLPPLEAMACGCFVVGYAGQGGKEYLKPEFSISVPEGDIITYVKEIEGVLETYEANPNAVISKGQLASEYVRSNFNHVNEREDIRTAFEKLLKY